MDQADECAVCLEGIDVLDRATTRCGHTFHTSCLCVSARRRPMCPLCRAPLAPQHAIELKERGQEEVRRAVEMWALDSGLLTLLRAPAALEVDSDDELQPSVSAAVRAFEARSEEGSLPTPRRPLLVPRVVRRLVFPAPEGELPSPVSPRTM